MTSVTYSGVYSIPVTPFNEDKTIDFKSLEKWIAPRLEKPTIDGFFLNALNTAIIPSEDTNLEDTIIIY